MILANARISFIALQAYNLFHPDPSAPVGGAEVQILQLAGALVERGCRGRVICLAERDGAERHGALEVVTISRAHGAFDKARRILRALAAQETDCVMQRASGLETWLAARYARRHKKPFVFMAAHEMDTLPFQWRDWTRWRRVLYRRGLLAANRIVAQSGDQAAMLKRYWKRDATVIRSFQPPPEPPAPGKKGLLWIGKAVAYKRPERFLELARRLPSIPCVMILNASHLPRYYEQLREEAARTPNITLLPHVPYDRIMDCFRATRALVGTSDAEGFPNTYLQAWRASTPVFALSCDPDQIIQREGCGFCAGDDFDLLVREIERRYKDEAWLLEAGKRGAEYLRREHDLARIAGQWAELLSAI